MRRSVGGNNLFLLYWSIPKYQNWQTVDLLLYKVQFRHCETTSIINDANLVISLIWASFYVILSPSFCFRGIIASGHIKLIKMRIWWNQTTHTLWKQQNALNITNISKRKCDIAKKNPKRKKTNISQKYHDWSHYCSTPYCNFV